MDDVFNAMRQFAAGRMIPANHAKIIPPTVEEIVAVGREAAERLGLTVPTLVLELRAEQIKTLCAGAKMRKVKAARSSMTLRRNLYGVKMRPERKAMA
jgi:hypothetical protein